jgi:transcriptional regulator with XRE-family HTH domain
MEDLAQIFEELRDEHRRDDGSKWTGAALERATGGAVSRTYISGLRRGAIKEPSFRKIVAISDAMGIPLEAWRGSWVYGE